MLGSADARHLANARDRGLNGIEKAEADIRHALIERVVAKLSEDVVAGRGCRDRAQRLFRLAGRATLGD